VRAPRRPGGDGRAGKRIFFFRKDSACRGTGGFGASTTVVADGAIDTSSAQDIVLTAQLANTSETITVDAYLVELFYQA
jgi:hypothetical protein